MQNISHKLLLICFSLNEIHLHFVFTFWLLFVISVINPYEKDGIVWTPAVQHLMSL